VLARQPDQVHLREAGIGAWRDGAAAERLTQPLLELGYETVGVFTAPEVPGVVLRLLVMPRECVLATVYEHPRTELWVELATRYTGGTACAITSGQDRGLAPRPGHPVTHLPGADPGLLHARLLALRPKGGMARVEASPAVRVFEEGFAEAMAWRKSQGISRGEVVRVAVRGVRRQRAA
jgi:hypothetical protein